jgi:hypothetical protein
MAELKVGDVVQIMTREVTNDDVKSGLYFAYFGGLVGNVDRMYDDGSVCVEIDIDSLTEDARKRHLDTQEAERKRWLDGLSGEARNRLTEDQKKLKISYKILVSKKDVEPTKGPKKKTSQTSEESGSNNDSAADNKGPARAPDPAEAEDQPVKRLSEADLAAKEEEFLRSLQDRSH